MEREGKRQKNARAGTAGSAGSREPGGTAGFPRFRALEVGSWALEGESFYRAFSMLRHNAILMVYTLEHSDVTAVFLSLSYSRSLME